jgi:hypothetical protein
MVIPIVSFPATQHLLEPAAPAARVKGARVRSRPWRANPRTARSRRGQTAAGSAGWGRRQARDTQQGQLGAARTALVRRQPSLINGGGCAAAVFNQSKRLRRGEYQGDR